jgi:phospholipid-binding lipoprotein MlaA
MFRYFLSPLSAFLLLAGLFFSGLAFGAGAPPPSSLPPSDVDEDYLEELAPVVRDPLEGWNRAVFRFNDALIEHAARPAYRGYVYVTPDFMRTGIKNFFHNAAFPARFVNNLLQGRGRAAGVEMSRFMLNTTAGLGGLFDVAKHHEPIVPVEDEDMGQTFGVWGAGEGFYIVWPLLGPSTARDSLGLVGDYFLDPFSYFYPWEVDVGLRAVSVFNGLDEMLDLYDALKGSAIEPYSSVRDAYVQYRQAKIAK